MKNSVRVRIAVALDEFGNWFAAGGNLGNQRANDDEWRDEVLEAMDYEGEQRVCFVEVDIPLPKRVTIFNYLTV
jgi:hypothetical protein